MPGESPVEVAKATTGPLSTFLFKEEQNENCQQQATCVVMALHFPENIRTSRFTSCSIHRYSKNRFTARTHGKCKKAWITVENALLSWATFRKTCLTVSQWWYKVKYAIWSHSGRWLGARMRSSKDFYTHWKWGRDFLWSMTMSGLMWLVCEKYLTCLTGLLLSLQCDVKNRCIHHCHVSL